MTDSPFDLSGVRKLADSGRFNEALELCTEIINREPESSAGYHCAAKLYARMGDYAAAVTQIDLALERNIYEPALHFARGRWNLCLRRYAAARDDFSRALVVEEQYGRGYYVEMSFFFRAVAHKALGDLPSAVDDCAHVRDDVQVTLFGMLVRKTDILKDVGQAD